tara:strand:- start:1361 stop:1630 length:270 start_codon:yes stop_codon:yes gene_type:complete
MKASTLIYGALVFYILGKYGKIPRHAMNLVWSFSLGGCLFLSIGLFLNNYQLIRGGLFITGILVLLLIHTILTKHQKFKERLNDKINPK